MSAFRWNDNLRATAAELYRRGKSVNAIAERLNCSSSTVSNEIAALRRKGWDLPLHGHRIDEGGPPLKVESPDDYRRATSLHLQDILREHGFAKRWPTYDVPAERPHYVMPLRAPMSLIGSAAEMCAEGGGLGTSYGGRRTPPRPGA